MKKKKCTKCQTIKLYEEFHNNRNKPDGKREWCKICVKEYYLENIESITEKKKLWNKNNPDKRKKYFKKYYDERSNKSVVKQRLRNRMNLAVRNIGFTKTKGSMELVGCDYNTLKEHIESQFEPGMNWDNHTKDGWHIDHIIPLYTAKNEKELYELFHYKNLRPLWAIDNQTRNKTSKKLLIKNS